MTAAATECQVTHYGVAFGPDEEDRQTYIDYGDGSFISRDAEIRAARFFLQLASARRPCGFWVNGRLTAGEDLCPPPDEVVLDPAYFRALRPVVVHKTRTVLYHARAERFKTKSNGSCGRWVRNDDSVALCTCGWSSHASTRAEARAAARYHRTTLGVSR